ncbi:DNA-binding transcriptional regulator, LysR family [Sphingobium sp. AP50]|uniref:LysR family transcriptional regulator n=1 Tax=Sphingobium sp. AP50 TaxID=1884369 RepID=UPI0008BDE05B|nr:LysR family transcriptional regulator [Sphingobium sp. AP50]SEJ50491.1 DNA-binding transcriptional regulator, LysR family [Sphingobium sp. AP50]
MIELKQLRKFLVVAEQGNFTRAAEHLNIAQPALSRQIARLEEQLGIDLIDRQSRPFQLTRAGRHLQKESAALLEQAGRMERTVRQIGSRTMRVLNVAFSPTIVYGGLPDVMSRVEERLRHIDVRWSELRSSELAESLRMGSIDIAFSRHHDDDEKIVHVRLRDEKLFAAFSRRHPFASHDGAVSISDLDGFDLIIYPGNSKMKGGFADQTSAWFAEFGRRNAEIREVNEIDTALALAAAGMGVCLVPATARHLRSDIEYRLIDQDEVHLPVYLCHRVQEDEELVSSIKSVIRDFMATDSATSLDPQYQHFYDF